MTIADGYAKGRYNGLNGIRLILAISVILWHSFSISGAQFTLGDPAQQLMSHGFVDGFFGISGFLIAASWIRTPRAAAYLRARTIRIFPAFWVCLVITALVFAPISVALTGGNPWGLFTSSDTYEYILKNAGLWVFSRGIEGTLEAVPYPEAWNGSLWTLAWEFFCYLGILALGVAGLVQRKSVLWVLFGAAWFAALVVPVIGFDSTFVYSAIRFSLMFLSGTLLAAYSSQITVRWWSIVVCTVAVLVSAWLPDYRVVGALALTYLLVALGAIISHPKMQFKNDISYGVYIYAFPIQQLVASAGGASLGVLGFWIVSCAITFPVAALSWFLVEKPSLRFKKPVKTIVEPVHLEQTASVRHSSADHQQLK